MPLNKLFKSFSENSKPHHRDYTFTEWQALPYEIKRDIWKNYWNPYKPEIGQSTRDAIIDEFKRSYPELVKKSFAIGYDYFGWMVGCIYIVVPKSSIRVPQEFASIFVNKGYLYKRIDKETVQVNWRYGGTKSEFKLSTG
jgi:hypothetical protein